VARGKEGEQRLSDSKPENIRQPIRARHVAIFFEKKEDDRSLERVTR
jgi:hypothetical protein